MAPFGFTQGWKFFHVNPVWVTDPTTTPPGAALIEPRPTFAECVKGFLTMSVLWDTENLLWLLMAVCVSFFFPYDLRPDSNAATSPLNAPFFCERFPLWFVLAMGYVGFFHVALCVWKWRSRPFVPDPKYRVGKVLHNIFYSLTGVVLWVCFENVVCYLWATGALAYSGPLWFVNNSTATVSKEATSGISEDKTAGQPVAVVVAKHILIAVFGYPFSLLVKDLSFYFSHRFLHFGPLFAHIHSLHHRNADPEPFSGLAMHPIEHLYYFASAITPLLLSPFPLHPSAFTWVGLHLLVSPALAHSGIEDHWQNDTYHYFHHRFFDCNFAGGGVTFLDEWCGTAFWGGEGIDGRIKNKRSSASNKNDESENAAPPSNLAAVLARAPTDEKASLVPEWNVIQNKDGMFSIYMLLCALSFAPWVLLVSQNSNVGAQMRLRQVLRLVVGDSVENQKWTVALLAAFGPILAALLLDGSFNPIVWLRPFAKKRPAWETALHVVCGLALTAVPVAVVIQRSIARI